MSLEYSIKPEFIIDDEREMLVSVMFNSEVEDAPVAWRQIESPVGNPALTRATRLVLEGIDSELVINQKPGWSLEAPGFEVLIGDRSVFLGTVAGAMETALTYAQVQSEIDELVSA